MSPDRLAVRSRALVLRTVPAMLLFLSSVLVPACGTPLLATTIETNEAHIDELRRGGLALSCHERPSHHFRLYLVCPEQKTVLGVSDSLGHLGFTCPDMRKKKCRAFVERMRAAGACAPAPSAP